MRWFLSWFAVGAFIGTAVATLVAPIVLETFLASTGAKDAMCQCTELVASTAALLIKTQLWGAGAGGLIFPSAAFAWRRRRGKSLVPPTQGPAV